MPKFFINRPIVAMVIAILMVIVGLVSMSSLPIALFPNIVPPEIKINSTYSGADAQTVEQSVSTPIEQQLSGVDNLNYMYSINANNGASTITANFDVKTDASTDQILTQMREGQAESQLPSDVRNLGVTVQKSMGSPLVMFALYSPKGTYDNVFLSNYCYININDQMTRVKGVASVTVFGAGPYAMRLWVKPDQLAKMGITIPEITNAISAQNTVNPAGQIGSEPVPKGQDFTYAVRAQGRLEKSEDFENIVIRANTDGSVVRLKDVARAELGAQYYNMSGRFNGKPAAILAVYQLPGTNAIEAANGAKKLMAEISRNFPADLKYQLALDTTESITEGIREIVITLFEALALVIIVVFIFLQGWRSTLIPLLAVPVSLVGTFMLFPLLGFSINTLSLFGLVLAIGLVVDDAIVVVEAVESHIEKGLPPKEAALKAMEEVSGPVVAIALILAAVFIPTAFIPGITGRLYQQFAITIAVSVIISAFNALSLSPALSALLLRPRKEARGPLGKFFGWFNRVFGRATEGYVGLCGTLIRKTSVSIIVLVIFIALAGLFGKLVPTSFLPEEDQGYLFAIQQLPDASSLQRTIEASQLAEKMIQETPGVESCTAVSGYNLISGVTNTYSTSFFIKLKNWSERKNIKEHAAIVKLLISKGLYMTLPGEGLGMAFAPPAIPGVGTAGGITMMLEDRSGKDLAFLSENVDKFIAEAKKRPELASASSTFRATVPQVFVDVDRDKVIKQGVNISDVYKTLQCFMGGSFVNFFNRFGRQWQIYVQAEGEYRTKVEDLRQFYVRNSDGDMVPLSALTASRNINGPEFTMRYNLYRCAQINAQAAPGYSTDQAMQALEEVFAQSMPREMGMDYMAMSFQEKQAQEGVSPMVIFGFSLLCVFLILAAQYESWGLPFSVLLGTPIAVMGAFASLYVFRSLSPTFGGKISPIYENNIYAQIGLVMLIGLAAKNAILIVEFAKMELEKGKPLIEAALTGAKIRLRPILMTSFAFILGCLPLATASGAGAISRRIMGLVVIGGMVAATGIAIFLIPFTFYVVQKLSGKENPPAISTPQQGEGHV